MVLILFDRQVPGQREPEELPCLSGRQVLWYIVLVVQGLPVRSIPGQHRQRLVSGLPCGDVCASGLYRVSVVPSRTIFERKRVLVLELWGRQVLFRRVFDVPVLPERLDLGR